MNLKKTVLKIFTAIALIFLTSQIVNAEERQPTKTKGATNNMQTHYIGRFSIGVPAEMKIAGIKQGLRDTEIKEVVWPKDKKIEETRDATWNNYITEIKKLEPPDGTKNVIVKLRDFPDVGYWAKAVLYHGDSGSLRTATWRLLMDIGTIGIWFKTSEPVVIEKDAKSNIIGNNFSNLAKSYRVLEPNTPRLKGDWFYLQHGAINLPYKWQEKSYVRFEGHPLDIKLEIEMSMDSRYAIETTGLMEKMTAAIVTNFAPGVSVERIRSRKRVVAGLEGEEELDRMSEKDNAKLSFKWQYNGRKDSGTHPETLITMYFSDGNLDEKLKIWDAVLDSMQPMYK